MQLLSWLSNQLHYYQLEDTTYCKLLFPQEMTQCLHDSSTFTCGPSGLDNSRFYLLLWRRCPTESWMSRPVDSASRIKQYLGVKVVVITMGNETCSGASSRGICYWRCIYMLLEIHTYIPYCCLCSGGAEPSGYIVQSVKPCCRYMQLLIPQCLCFDKCTTVIAA